MTIPPSLLNWITSDAGDGSDSIAKPAVYANTQLRVNLNVVQVHNVSALGEVANFSL